MRLSEDLWEMMEEAKSILREESVLHRGAADTFSELENGVFEQQDEEE